MPHLRETADGVGAIGNMSFVHGHYATGTPVRITKTPSWSSVEAS